MRAERSGDTAAGTSVGTSADRLEDTSEPEGTQHLSVVHRRPVLASLATDYTAPPYLLSVSSATQPTLVSASASVHRSHSTLVPPPAFAYPSRYHAYLPSSYFSPSYLYSNSSPSSPSTYSYSSPSNPALAPSPRNAGTACATAAA